MLYFVILSLLSFQAFSQKIDVSGNIEGQGRFAHNNSEAKKDLFQNWDDEEFYMLYGNLHTKSSFKNSKLETNIFLRTSQSDLYKDNYLAPLIYNFPSELLARDVFKLKYKRQDGNHQNEVVINQLSYHWNYHEHRFQIGRMAINYGLGEIFNPINPFNQPTGLTSTNQVAQGNDGLRFTLFINENYQLSFFLLGDKNQEDYEDQITRTAWAHGEIQASDNLSFEYVIGEDQRRQKLGGQVAYQLGDALIFLQTLYQSHLVNKKPSTQLWDILLGYDQQILAKHHLRFEGGYQKTNRFSTGTGDFSDRFLPTEYFASISHKFEFHPLASLSSTVIYDIKSQFSYFLARNTYSLSKNTEGELFVQTPLSKSGKSATLSQKLVTSDVGIALRAFF